MTESKRSKRQRERFASLPRVDRVRIETIVETAIGTQVGDDGELTGYAAIKTFGMVVAANVVAHMMDEIIGR